MSNDKTEISEQTELKEQQELSDAFSNIFETLVPPKSVTIEDAFGNIYEISTFISARNQIKLLREFDKIKNSVQIELVPENMLAQIVSLCMKEEFLNILCECFYIGHKSIFTKSLKFAKKQKMVFDDEPQSCADLFAIEEMAAAIIPLFIRMIRRAGQAIQALQG